jgi:hypothetical protein
MRLSAPTKVVFIISVILLIVGLLINFGFGFLDPIKAGGFWITFAGGALLAIGAFFKGI